MAGRTKRKTVIHDTDSEDSISLEQQVEVKQERLLDTPSESPLSTPPSSPPQDILIPSSTDPPVFSSSEAAEANEYLARPHTHTPPLNNSPAPADMDLKERTAEFQAESAEIRAGSRVVLAPEVLPDEEMPPRARTVTDAILDVVRTATRKILIKGDVAIIIEPSDLKRTLLVSYNCLAEAAPDLCKHALDTHSGQSLKLVVILQPAHQTIMPLLSTIKSDFSEDEFKKKYGEAQTCTGAAAVEARTSDNIKKEDQGDRNPEISTDEPSTNWKNAYETVFAIIAGAKQVNISRMLGDKNSPLLLQIECVLAIASQYNLLNNSALKVAFSLLLMEFVTYHTLWSAIAKKPASWLMIGLKMRNDMVYKEALIHVVGSYPDCIHDMQVAGVPDHIGALVHRKSAELRCRRLGVDQELGFLNLVPKSKALKKKKSGEDATLDEEMVTYKHNTVAFQTRAIFHAFIGHQIRLIEASTDGEEAKCKYSLTGFYRAIGKGGDAYLAADDVVADWEDEEVPFDEGKVREMLKLLKSKASEKVASLIQSTLQYERKDELEDLTCVQVEESDVPWKKDEDIDMEDE